MPADVNEEIKIQVQLDIDAINVDVKDNDKASPEPRSTRAKGKGMVPKLDLGKGIKQAPDTPKSSARTDTQPRLSTLRESEIEDDPMNNCQMATTNEQNDSATIREAERNFRKMLEDRTADDEDHRKQPDTEPIDDQ